MQIQSNITIELHKTHQHYIKCLYDHSIFYLFGLQNGATPFSLFSFLSWCFKREIFFFGSAVSTCEQLNRMWQSKTVMCKYIILNSPMGPFTIWLFACTCPTFGSNATNVFSGFQFCGRVNCILSPLNFQRSNFPKNCWYLRCTYIKVDW